MATSKAVWIAGVVLAAGAGFVGGSAAGGLGLFDGADHVEPRPDAHRRNAARERPARGP